MTNKVRYKVLYNRANRLDKHGQAAVIIEAYQQGVRRYFTTGIRLKPIEWDKKSNGVKGNPDYNRLIRTRIGELETFELLFPTPNKRSFTLKDFDLLPENQPVKEIKIKLSFTEFLRQQIERDKNKISRATYTRYTLVAKMLTEFNEGKAVCFDSLTYPFIEGYDHYLSTVRKYKKNTIVNQHKVINRFLIKASRLGLFEAKKSPYHDFNYRKEPTEPVVFHPSEIRRIEELTFNEANKHLAFYRDVFLLAFYTLLRISDITSIRQKHIIEENGKLELEMIAQKTKKTNRLPLYKLHQTPTGISKPEEIILRYSRSDNKPLFNRSHPIINEYVKQVFHLAGISKPATFHTSRHSGITFLVTKIPLPFVQQLAQHSDIKTTMFYVHISKQLIDDALDGVNWYN